MTTRVRRPNLRLGLARGHVALKRFRNLPQARNAFAAVGAVTEILTIGRTTGVETGRWCR